MLKTVIMLGSVVQSDLVLRGRMREPQSWETLKRVLQLCAWLPEKYDDQEISQQRKSKYQRRLHDAKHGFKVKLVFSTLNLIETPAL